LRVKYENPLARGGLDTLHVPPMIYPFTLKPTMLAIGVLLVVLHLLALLRSRESQVWLKGFPRSRFAGVLMMIVAGVWFFWLARTMDLGEFTPMRRALLIGGPVAAVLSILYVKDFLAVRAFGILVLLAAEPLLEAAFLREEQVRLLLVTLTYVHILAAMFWVGMPYLMRDLIGWVSSSQKRWRAAAFAGLAYGILLCAGGFACA